MPHESLISGHTSLKHAHIVALNAHAHYWSSVRLLTSSGQVEELQAQLEQRAREEVYAAVQTLATPPSNEATPPMVMIDVLERRAA